MLLRHLFYLFCLFLSGRFTQALLYDQGTPQSNTADQTTAH